MKNLQSWNAARKARAAEETGSGFNESQKMAGGFSFCFFITVNIFTLIIGLILAIVGAGLPQATKMVARYVTLFMGSILENLPQKVDIKVIVGYILFVAMDVSKVVLTIGLMFLLIGIFSFFGICIKKKILMIIYIIVTFITALSIVSVGAYQYRNNTWIKPRVKTIMDGLLENYKGIGYNDSNTVFMDAVNAFFQCCGMRSGEDFKNITWNSTFFIEKIGFSINLKYPLSCCKLEDFQLVDKACVFDPKTNNSNFETGCWNIVSKKLDVTTIIGLSIMGIGGILGIPLLLSVCILLSMQKNKVNVM